MDVSADMSRGAKAGCRWILNSIQRKSSGFTLLELLISIAILSILFSVGVPSLHGVITSNRLTSNINQIISLLSYSRTEAIKRGQRVTLCQTTDQLKCSKTGTWNTGWMLFVDQNNNKTVDNGDTLLSINRMVPKDVQVTFNGSGGRDGYVIYKPDGSAFPNGSFTICNPKYPNFSKSLIMQHNGRLRLSNKTSTGKAIKCTPA